MTILNRQSDGLPSILLTLTRLVAREKEITRDSLLALCSPPGDTSKDKDGESSASGRLRGTLSRWTSLGLFSNEDGKIKLNFQLRPAELADENVKGLTEICRRLLFESQQALPLWPKDGSLSEENAGLAADLCRGLAWCLAQDIYALPSSFVGVEALVQLQVQDGRFIFLNDTRWPGLLTWARYLGFATGEDSRLLFDPTIAVRGHIDEVINAKESLPASEFIGRLAVRLPVLDSGTYRMQVESSLKLETWHPPATDHLSMSLSLALRRLQKQGLLSFETKADAGSRLTFTGQYGRSWGDFTHVRLLEGTK